jgi:hypothetical protein
MLHLAQVMRIARERGSVAQATLALLSPAELG